MDLLRGGGEGGNIESIMFEAWLDGDDGGGAGRGRISRTIVEGCASLFSGRGGELWAVTKRKRDVKISSRGPSNSIRKKTYHLPCTQRLIGQRPAP